MTEQNEQEFVETPEMTEDLKNDPKALYELLGAVVHSLEGHSIKLRAKERQTKYVLRIDDAEEQTLIVSNKIVPEWAEEKPTA